MESTEIPARSITLQNRGKAERRTAGRPARAAQCAHRTSSANPVESM
ncbi:MAG: hypothetical protein M3Q47_17530 [Actinomycetota bacterium]|nr:hypothetical protein [Actinomycetota bacterium]